jgi:MarR family 2-MHQ and catechol resistance regulon transcriptional repressor
MTLHSRRIAKEGITLTQFNVLEAIYHGGPMCQKELGEKLLKTSGNITMVIDNLEKRELLKRKRRTDDRRYMTVVLSAKGRRFIERILPDYMAGVAEDMQILNTEELEELRRTCRVLGKQKKD